MSRPPACARTRRTASAPAGGAAGQTSANPDRKTDRKTG